MITSSQRQLFINKGYGIIDDVYSISEMSLISNCISDYSKSINHKDNKDLFAIRQLLNVIPDLKCHLLNKNLRAILNQFYNSNYFLTKAIYFDKPPTSNWFVPYHQDLSVSVNSKSDLIGYSNWTFKAGQYGVQPPIEFLERTITVRIHLDNTKLENGALRIIPHSHNKGVIRKQSDAWNLDNETVCDVNKGGIMLMKPLLLHASSKTTNNKRRRVIHLEFNDKLLDYPLKWLEYHSLN